MTVDPAWKTALRVAEDEVSLPLFRRLAIMLDQQPSQVGDGDIIPLAWSAILFPTLARQSEIGPDGHARHGDFIPTMPLPRRMFAGRTMEQVRPIRIGARLTRRSTITSVTQKTGRSGQLIFVTITHEISGNDGLCFTERQEVVFREEAAEAKGRKAADPMPVPHWTSRFSPDPVLLFRYSALTFNSHRIHFDAPYAKGVEGYPGLVVNGGLTALKLLEFARQTVGEAPTLYTVRAMQPLYAGEDVLLNGLPTDDGATFWATNASNATAMIIKVGKFG